jgi:hypothetical protein
MKKRIFFMDGHGASLLAMTKPYLKPFFLVMTSDQKERGHPEKTWTLRKSCNKIKRVYYPRWGHSWFPKGKT